MTTAHTLRIVNPVGQRATERISLARRLETLNGKSIGFIDNIKPNAGLFIRCIEDLLRANFSGLTTHTVRKNFTSSKLIAHELDGKVQALVNAWGD